MLVLSRKIGEEIVIGDNIRIKVLNIVGGKVRIGIVAPDDVTVDRQEIHEQRLSTLPTQRRAGSISDGLATTVAYASGS